MLSGTKNSTLYYLPTKIASDGIFILSCKWLVSNQSLFYLTRIQLTSLVLDIRSTPLISHQKVFFSSLLGFSSIVGTHENDESLLRVFPSVVPNISLVVRLLFLHRKKDIKPVLLLQASLEVPLLWA